MRFQSAPLTKARGDISPVQAFPPTRFQSAPLTKARGDRSIPRSAWTALLFQSAPLTKARGDDGAAECLAQEERLFQSAPLTKARGDQIHRSDGYVFRGARFNPLPSQKQGETWRLIRSIPCPSPRCFNPLPSQKQGETIITSSEAMCDLNQMFQSAPLTKARGDQWAAPTDHVNASMFQSAPLTKARGDMPYSCPA